MRARLFGVCALPLLAAACTSSSTSITTPTAAKCAVAVNNENGRSVPAGGMSSTLAVTTNRDCTWTAATSADWIAITSAPAGQGDGSVNYRVSANAAPATRQATLDINDVHVAVTQDAAPCLYSVGPANSAVPASGGTVALTIDTLTGCTWSAATSAPWIVLPANATGNRSGTLTITIARNTDPVARSGKVTVGQQTATIEQAGMTPDPPPAPTPTPNPPAPPPTPTPPPPAACSFAIAPAGSSIGAEESTGTIQVTAGSGCAWTATETTSWLEITAGASGSGNGSLTYHVAANTGSARSATITVADKTFTIAQAAAPPPACTLSISPSSQNIADTGGTGSIAVTASAAGCAWTATTSVSWIAITGGQSGTGSGTVTFTVSPNSGTSPRTATIAAAGTTFTVTQAGAPPPPCTFTIAPTGQSIADAGGSGSVAVTASAATCAWTAVANVPWLTIGSGQSGTGNGTVAFTAAANTGVARSGTLTVGGQTFTVTQAAAPQPCTFSIAPTAQSVADTGGSGSVALTASAATCAWTASANVAWLTLSGGASGTGNSTVAFTVAVNTGPPRSGTLTIGGQTFTVSQAAPPLPPCTFGIAPTSQDVSASGGSGSISVTASPAQCAWTATAGAPWLTITSGASGTGDGTVGFSAAANPGGLRSGTLTIAGQTFTVTQAGEH